MEEIAEKGDDLYCDQREAEDYAADQRKLVNEMNKLTQSMRFKKTEFARAVKKIPKHEYEAATAELLRAIPGSGHTLPPVAMVRIRTKFPKILERIVRERTQHLVYEYLPLKNEPNKESTYGIDEDLNAVAILPPLPPRELFAQVRDSEEPPIPVSPARLREVEPPNFGLQKIYLDVREQKHSAAQRAALNSFQPDTVLA